MSAYRTYKGYLGVFAVDDDADLIRGRVVNTRDTITFQGATVSDAVQAFRDSVDDYLAWCEEDGVEPEKPFSGKILIRVRPEDHRAITAVAQIKGVSVNKLVAHTIKKLAGRLPQLEAAKAAVTGEVKPKRSRKSPHA